MIKTMKSKKTTNTIINKIGGERQIPYDLTYKRNLIKKTNKENITKDIELKNKLTITRGEGEGDNGGKMRKSFQEHI